MEKDIRFKKIQDLLEKAKIINSWDHNYVMRDLKRSDRLEASKKEELKKVQKANIKWKSKLENVKKVKEEIYQEHQEKIQNKVKSKSSKKSLNLSKDSSEQDNSYLHSIHSLSKSTDFKQIKANVELCQLKEEKKRLKLQESINKKLEKITNKNKILKNKKKKKFKEKFQKYENYLNNIKHIEEEKSQKLKKIELAKIERFRLYHEYLDKQKVLHNKIKQKEKQKIEHLDEKLKLMNEIQEGKRKEVEEKLLVQRSKINKYNLIRMNSLEKKVSIGAKRFEEKSKLINLNKNSINKLVLEKELKALEKSNLRDNSFDLCRHNIHENTMITQIELDRKLEDVYSKMKVLKNLSILNKPSEERKDIFIEIKRTEYEKKKKEEDEAKMLSEKL